MKHRWELDRRYPDDTDLEVLHADGDWRIIAFIRWNRLAEHYVCGFMGFNDNEYPDGKTFKTERGAKNFCERHMPVIWIRHNTKGNQYDNL